MNSRRTSRVALIVPASNTVMECDFSRAEDSDVEVTVWRIHLDSVTRAAEERMLEEELPVRLDEIAPTEPNLVVFGCTSAGALGGLGHDASIAQSIVEATGADVVTVVGAMVERLDSVGCTQVAVFTPYSAELTRAVAACVTESGHDVTMATGMGFVDNGDIGNVAPDDIVSFVRERMQGLNPDAVFLSCTNWRALEVIEPLQEVLGVPVLTSNQVTLDSMRSRLLVGKA